MTYEQKRLLAIAKGCKDYGGGYRNDEKGYRAFQHGIQTVINALESSIENPNDIQAKMLETIGRE